MQLMTVNIYGKTFIFMDFFPCKAKDLPAKMAKLTATIEKYRGDNNGRTSTPKHATV